MSANTTNVGSVFALGLYASVHASVQIGLDAKQAQARDLPKAVEGLECLRIITNIRHARLNGENLPRKKRKKSRRRAKNLMGLLGLVIPKKRKIPVAPKLNRISPVALADYVAPRGVQRIKPSKPGAVVWVPDRYVDNGTMRYPARGVR